MVSAKQKTKVRKRAKNICEYCLALGDYAFHPFCIDHIIPISQGGAHDIENLAFSCQHCNNCKYNKSTALDPLNGQEVRLFNPRKDLWLDHFMWNTTQSKILGISSIGRVTVVCLKMNRKEAINLRKVLASFGIHPPR